MIHRFLASLVLYGSCLLSSQSELKHHQDEKSCFFRKPSESAIPLITKQFSPANHAIFFHESECKSDLTTRQACSVESAASQNPHCTIYVLFFGDVTNQSISTGHLYTLRKMPNVRLLKAFLLDYLVGTPFQDTSAIFRKTTYGVTRVIESLPFVTLYKYSGIYLGLDTLVVKPLKNLVCNFVTRVPRRNYIGTSVLAFSKNLVGRQVAEDVIRVLGKIMAEETWDVTASVSITEVMKKRCPKNQWSKMNITQCNGIHIYDSKYLCPVSYEDAHTYFEQGTIADEFVIVHDIWDEVTSPLVIHKKSPYANLASEYCPEIYSEYYRDFQH